MNNALAVNSLCSIWDNEQEIEVIRRIYAKDLSPKQFECFVGLGRAGNLDPFNREIWCVVYKGAPQIFIGRDGYRKIAQSNPDYEYHRTEAVYATDDIRFVDGQIRHDWSPVNRQELIGAYCIVKRKSSNSTSYIYVRLEDYDKKHSVWGTLKETMIQKVAEAQALRQAFHQMFKGTYHQAEIAPEEPKKIHLIEGVNQTEKVKNLLKSRMNKPIEHQENLLPKIKILLSEIDLPPERFMSALEHYEVESLNHLNYEQQQSFMNNLEKLKLRKEHHQ